MKRHIISASVTFLTGFAVVLLANIDTLTLENIEQGAWVGVAFAALRAGVKATLEFFLTKE